MSWRDELRRVTMPDGRRMIGASFRGVPFFVESADRAGGRRTIVHEFPLRDDPTVEDLGRRARVFSVEGYVIGDDYLRQRDALLAALEDVAGPGELVHPYYGTLRAVCSSLSVRETITDGGMARFLIEFSEAPAQVVAPAEAPDLDADVATAATAVEAALLLDLEDSYNIDGEPAFALESIADDLAALSVDLGANLAAITRDTQELARIDAEVKEIVGDAAALIREPADAITRLRAVLSALADTAAASPRSVFRAIMDVYDAVVIDLVEGDTDTRVLERANQQAMGGALRQALLVEAALRLVNVPHVSVDDAVADRARLVAAMDEQLADAGNAVYPAMSLLRASVLLAVPGDAVLARVVTTERRVAVPSLFLAYQLYGSLEQEQDIIDRNGIQHPGFIAGTVGVLSRG